MGSSSHINGMSTSNAGLKSSNNLAPAPTLSRINSKMMLACLGSLIVITIAVDTYFLSWPALMALGRRNHPDFIANGFQHRPQSSTTKLSKASSRSFAEVDMSKRKKQFPVVPAMVKQNRVLKTLPVRPNQQQQEIKKLSSPDTKAPFDFSKEPILKVFENAGIPPLNASMIEKLPTWDQIVKNIGSHPVIGGLETCQDFRQNVPAIERMMGSAGMFNTGTNLVTHLLKRNCAIPERVEMYGVNASKEAHGMRWQVPWGKHSPAKFKEAHSTEKAKAINKEWIMPVVTIRHPYSWMHSMCKNGYSSRWNHGRRGRNCPNLKEDDEWNQVVTKFADGRTLESDSLAHLWNDWYKMYLEDAKYPRVIVRLEDLVFHAKETTTIICECVGGEMHKDKPFAYVLDSAKADSRGHDTSTGFIQAWIKYSKDLPPNGGFERRDYEDAKEVLNSKFMEQFHYKHAEPLDEND